MYCPLSSIFRLRTASRRPLRGRTRVLGIVGDVLVDLSQHRRFRVAHQDRHRQRVEAALQALASPKSGGWGTRSTSGRAWRESVRASVRHTAGDVTEARKSETLKVGRFPRNNRYMRNSERVSVLGLSPSKNEFVSWPRAGATIFHHSIFLDLILTSHAASDTLIIAARAICGDAH